MNRVLVGTDGERYRAVVLGPEQQVVPERFAIVAQLVVWTVQDRDGMDLAAVEWFVVTA